MEAVISCLNRLIAGSSPSADEMERALGAVLDGKTGDAAAAALLTAVRLRGETADELEGAVRAVRARMTGWNSPVASTRLLDTCGTGGDGFNSVNLSTTAAIVIAACGNPVVKHGNRAASGNSGSSDVLAALGVASDPDPDALAACLGELNIAFLFAPRFHPGLARLGPIRRQLPFRTLFNLVGPLCNPASPAFQIVGSTDEGRTRLLAAVLARMPHIRRAAVVTGSDGLDEVTLAGPTHALIVEAGAIRDETWRPDDFGLASVGTQGLRVSGPQESASRIRRTLAGEPGPVRDYLLANAAAALRIADDCSLAEGVRRAATAIDSGAAADLLRRWATLSTGPPASCDAGPGTDRRTEPPPPTDPIAVPRRETAGRSIGPHEREGEDRRTEPPPTTRPPDLAPVALSADSRQRFPD
ncbi:MAG: anthranilate phosphoribosyltransferase [Isosphaeraceae bacterium]